MHILCKLIFRCGYLCLFFIYKQRKRKYSLHSAVWQKSYTRLKSLSLAHRRLRLSYIAENLFVALFKKLELSNFSALQDSGTFLKPGQLAISSVIT